MIQAYQCCEWRAVKHSLTCLPTIPRLWVAQRPLRRLSWSPLQRLSLRLLNPTEPTVILQCQHCPSVVLTATIAGCPWSYQKKTLAVVNDGPCHGSCRRRCVLAPKDLPRSPGYHGLRPHGLVAAGVGPLRPLKTITRPREEGFLSSSKLEKPAGVRRHGLLSGNSAGSNVAGHPRPHSCIAVAGPN